MISIRKLDPRRRQDIDSWIALPFRLYAKDPLWVPQMVGEAKDQLNPTKHPYYLHSEAEFLLAEKNGEIVGRLALLNNRRYNRLRQERTAFFTQFETIDDAAVAASLFDAAFDWCRHNSLDQLMGPKGFLTMDGMGLLAEGFHRAPALGIAYNPPFYSEFIEHLGFEKVTDFMSGWLTTSYALPKRVLSIADRVKKRYGFEIRHFESKNELREIAPTIIEAYNATFVENWEYVPITPQEANYIIARIMEVILPELPVLVLKDDEVAGFAIAYPDISNAIRRTKGRMWPLGWIHLLREQKRTTWANGNGAGILPKFQGRGVDAMIFTELARKFTLSPYEYAELVQIDEANERMQLEMTAMGVEWDKRHRIYQRTV